jgi:hypothetical protein
MKHTVPLNTPTEFELSPTETVTITLIDANHCPGAVMCASPPPFIPAAHPSLIGSWLTVPVAPFFIQVTYALSPGFWPLYLEIRFSNHTFHMQGKISAFSSRGVTNQEAWRKH